MEDLRQYVTGMARAAKKASSSLRTLSASTKSAALAAMAKAIGERRSLIAEANGCDISRGRAAGLSKPVLDRRAHRRARVSSLKEIEAFEGPLGELIGVIAMIYESRPNVTVDAAALCLKSGNASILRGGIDGNAVQYVERTDYEAIDLLVRQSGLVDLVIPRGGEALIRRVVEKATVPVIKHYKGVCHLYVDSSADLAMAAAVVANAKVQQPATCNALETLLVHEAVAARFLPLAKAAMPGVELRGCEKTRAILPGTRAAVEEDWYAEYLDLVLAVKIVAGAAEAAVDSSCVTVNVSTRLADGGVFGLGARIGISTDKLHARGPMGLRELTTYKWVVRGSGDLR